MGEAIPDLSGLSCDIKGLVGQDALEDVNLVYDGTPTVASRAVTQSSPVAALLPSEMRTITAFSMKMVRSPYKATPFPIIW